MTTPPDPHTKAVTQAMTKAEGYIASLVQPSGQLRALCSARAIETALTLILLEGTDFFPEIRPGLLSCCEEFLHAPAPEPTGTAIDLGDTFSRLLLHCATGHNLIDASQQLSRAVDAFGHSSTSRKKILFSVLLAEAGAIPFSSLTYTPDNFYFKSSQHWARLIMTSSKLIYGGGIGDPAFICLEDIAYLETSQCLNGSWENHIMLTVVALIALKHTRPESPYLRKGVTFLKDHLTPDGGVPFVPDIDIWLTAIAGSLLAERDVMPEVRSRMADYLVQVQGSDGGWGFSEEVGVHDIDDTAMCLLCLQSQDPDRVRYPKEIDAAEEFLLSFQNEDGGFPTYVAHAPSEVEVTAHVIMGLATGDQQSAAVEKACTWLLQQQSDDGSFPYEWTLSSHFAGSQVLIALQAGCPPDLYQRHRSKAQAFTLSTQNPDGGWGQFPGMHSTPLSAAYALTVLSQGEPDQVQDAVKRGQAYLLAHQTAEGEFMSPPDALGPRPLVYDVKLFATVYAYWALSKTTSSDLS